MTMALRSPLPRTVVTMSLGSLLNASRNALPSFSAFSANSSSSKTFTHTFNRFNGEPRISRNAWNVWIFSNSVPPFLLIFLVYYNRLPAFSPICQHPCLHPFPFHVPSTPKAVLDKSWCFMKLRTCHNMPSRYYRLLTATQQCDVNNNLDNNYYFTYWMSFCRKSHKIATISVHD